MYFLDRINNRLDTTKERINEPEGNVIKIIQIEAHEQEIDFKKWNTLNNLWDISSNLTIIGAYGEEREKKTENCF